MWSSMKDPVANGYHRDMIHLGRKHLGNKAGKDIDDSVLRELYSQRRLLSEGLYQDGTVT